MANKYRKKQVRVPYRKFQGKSDQLDHPDEKGELVYLGHVRKKAQQYNGFVTPAVPQKLPLELLRLIAEFCTKADAYNLLFVSKMWYMAALPQVYRAPRLLPINLAQFVDVLSHRKDLCSLVKDLDLSRTIQTGKNSWNAKILRKCSASLLRFVAAQTNFGFSPATALKACTGLRILDLAYVSDTVDLALVLDAIRGFGALEVIRFPRNSKYCGLSEIGGNSAGSGSGDGSNDGVDKGLDWAKNSRDSGPATAGSSTTSRSMFSWPPRLHSISISGGLAPEFLTDIALPANLKTLEFQSCPYITDRAILVAVSKLHLTSLSVHHPMPLLTPRGMDTVLAICPELTTLSISIEYISANLLDEEMATGHPLSRLYIHASGSLGLTNKMIPEDIYFATEYMHALKHIRLSVVLGWNSVTEEIIDEIAEVLDERGGGLYVV